jgi:hypothetical protein
MRALYHRRWYVLIHCITSYLPQTLCFLVPLLLWFSCRIFTSNPAGTPPPPIYRPCYLPPFVRGLMAMLQLGADGNAFLLTARKLYGPVVHIPWPIFPVFVLDGEVINSIYSCPSETLPFLPIRVSIQHSSFGTSKVITRSPIVHKQISRCTQEECNDNGTNRSIDPPFCQRGQRQNRRIRQPNRCSRRDIGNGADALGF